MPDVAFELTEFTVKDENSTNIGSSTGGAHDDDSFDFVSSDERELEADAEPQDAFIYIGGSGNPLEGESADRDDGTVEIATEPLEEWM